MSDLREAQAKEHIHKTPHFNSVSNYLTDPTLAETFSQLVTLSSLPLKGIENNFAVDSSGFSTCRFVRWFNKKYGREIDNREWVKAHLMCGVETKIVTSVDVSGWMANDTPYFVPLLERTAKYFHVEEVSADKAYISRKNLAATANIGAMPYIPFKTNTAVPKKNNVWSEMYPAMRILRESCHRFHGKRAIDSTPNLPLMPEQSCHRFHGKRATDARANWPPPEGAECDAGHNPSVSCAFCTP